jgi:hypothetical protein
MPDTIYGRSLQEARRVAMAQLTAFPVNSTSIEYVLVLPTGGGRVRIEAVYWTASAVLNDADGTMLVNVLARDASEGADDTIVNAQSVEGGTAHAVAAFALVAETAEKERTLDEGDSLRVTFVNNSAAIDTNGAITVFVVYHPIANDEVGAGVQRLSAYL